MKYVYLGKIVNTHGIKGEVRILSDFLYKEEVFKKERIFYIGNEKNKEVMHTYRPHKNYDMITFEGIDDINDVLKYKGKNIYIERSDLKIDGYVTEDLLNLVVQSDHEIGKVVDVLTSKAGRILVVHGKHKNMIPFVDEFIKEVNIQENYIKIKEIEGLIDED